MENEKELYRSIGQIEQAITILPQMADDLKIINSRVTGIETTLHGLPCNHHSKRLEELSSFAASFQAVTNSVDDMQDNISNLEKSSARNEPQIALFTQIIQKILFYLIAAGLGAIGLYVAEKQ